MQTGTTKAIVPADLGLLGTYTINNAASTLVATGNCKFYAITPQVIALQYYIVTTNTGTTAVSTGVNIKPSITVPSTFVAPFTSLTTSIIYKPFVSDAKSRWSTGSTLEDFTLPQTDTNYSLTITTGGTLTLSSSTGIAVGSTGWPSKAQRYITGSTIFIKV